MIDGKKVTAIILAAGKGKRMGSKVSKQYLLMEGKPILYYTLTAFENSIVDEMILVVGKDDEEYCRQEILEQYSFQKIAKVIIGGKERYDSVYAGLKAMKDSDSEIVLIHDAARPFVDNEIITRAARSAMLYKTGVVGVKVKDTIKVVDSNDCVLETPDRNTLWQIQTPQAFSYPDILTAYETVLNKNVPNITDDAMIWEYYSDIPVKIVEGSYFNIKITTQEDLVFGSAICKYSSDIM